VGKIPGSIGRMFSTAGWWLFHAGQDVLQGFWNGLAFVWYKVIGWIPSLAGWIKAHKGPVSFDRSLLEPAGRAIMTGLRVGLEGGRIGIKGIVSGMAGSIGTRSTTGTSMPSAVTRRGACSR
jgi:phage-related protein